MKLTLAAGLFVAASAAAFAQAPAGSSSAQGSATPSGSAQQQGSSAQPAAGKAAAEQTLTGCLTSADNIYTLTVMDDTGAPGSTAETIAYTLAPGTGVDLQSHLNKRITVKGTDAGQDAASSNRVVMNSPAAPAATGTSGTASSNAKPTDANGSSAGASASSNGNSNSSATSGSGATPKVETSAKTRITQRTFNVTNVQPASGNCGA